MPIKLNGSSSGYTQIEAAATAGDNTLTLPTASGTLMTTGGSNTFTANQVIEVTDDSNAALRITQLGTGAAIRVEDSTNPDSTPFVVDASGNVGIGTASPAYKVTASAGGGDAASLNVSGVTSYLALGSYLAGTNGAARVAYDRSTGSILFSNGLSDSSQTERMRIDGSGNVGIGTTSMSKKFVVSNGGASGLELDPFTRSGTTGSSILSYNRSGSAFTRLDLDALEQVFFTSTNERMRIDSNGKVLVGTSSTFIGASNLQIASSLNEQIAIRSTAAAAGRCWRFTADSNNTTYIINQDTVGVYIGNGNSSWSSLSDERTKDIIEPITDAANKVSRLRAVIGKYKTDEEGKRRSFLIAQDVQAVLPEAVSVANAETGHLGLSYTDTIPLLTAALQEALTKIDALEARIAALENA